MIFWIGLLILVAVTVIFALRSKDAEKTLRFLMYFMIGAVVVFFSLRMGNQLLAILAGIFMVVIPAIIKLINLAASVKSAREVFSDSAKMSVDEAEKILGVKATDSAEKIKAAYKKLIEKNHPDKDGSEYLAQKINAAKELLLKGKK